MRRTTARSGAEEHCTALSQVVEIRRCLDIPGNARAASAWRREQGEKLKRLIRALRAHFAREEARGGLYERLRRARPGTARELARLTDQHRIFLTWGRDLAAATARRDTDLASLRENLLAFFTRLARHEAREHELQSGN